jgi:hypothetical protein
MKTHILLSTLLTLPLAAPILAAQTVPATIPRTITINSANTFTVPSGVSTIIVEGWGGGGGGAYTGGGGGGGYFRIVLSVTAGATLTLSPGAGGTAGTAGSFGGEGGNTTMAYKSGATTIDCTAVGGIGSQYLVVTPGANTYFCTGPSANGIPLAYTGKAGQYGDTPRTIAIGPRSTTSYTASVIGGDGGDAGNAPKTGGQGNTQTYAYLINPNAASGISPSNDSVQANVSNNISQARAGLLPGGGGGGTASIADPNLPAAAGAAGLLLITY